LQYFIHLLRSMALWLALGLAKILIFTLPFKRLAPMLGESAGVLLWVPLLNLQQQAVSRRIARAVQRVAATTPWDSNCFPQAIVARWLLGAYGIPYVIFFGLKRDKGTGKLKAHAWVVAGRVAVAGGQSFNEFAVTGSFVSPLLKDAVRT
jgi:hypothetical protein